MANNQASRFSKYIHRAFPAVLLLFIFVFSWPVFGLEQLLKTDKPENLFQQANGFYQQRQYQKAVETYQQLLTGGFESGNLYYNLGNAYYKMKHKGIAVLYYRKALRLIPGDADLKANLAYVQDKTGQPVRGTWHYEVNHFLAYLATIDQLTVISSILFFILSGLIIVMILFPQKIKDNGARWKPLWLYGLMITVVLFVAAFAITLVTARELSTNQAVAVAPTAEVRFEPNPAATIYYELKEGAVVNILETKAGWVLIKRPDGKRGWVEQKNLTMI